MALTLDKQIQQHLSALDKAQIGDSALFQRQGGKDLYETFLSHALAKVRSAHYHLSRVYDFITADDAEMEKFAEILSDDHEQIRQVGIGRGKLEFTVSRTANEYAFEFCAFLVEIKAALDFLATITAFHLQGIEADSISTLIRLVGRGRTSNSLAVVAKWAEWLINIRDYRHRIAHRLVIRPSTGYVVQSEGGHRPRHRIPVIVPESSPQFVMDTRESRLQESLLSDEGPTGLDIETVRMTATMDDGREEIVHIETKAWPAPGYMTIEDFMRYHLANLEAFFTELLISLGQFKLEVVE